MGRPRAARPDGDGGLRDDGRRRVVLGPVGPAGRGAGDRPGRAADGARRRRRVDLGARRRGSSRRRDQVLDIFHASQHLAAAAAALHGEGTAAAAEWLERGRAPLLADGWPGLLDHIGATPAEGRTAAGQAALDEMIAYFAKHTDRLGYYGRLRSGRSIGSGAVEGLARRMGRRLKVPGRGWCAGNLDGMAALIADGRHPGVGWPLGQARRLISRIESYTRHQLERRGPLEHAADPVHPGVDRRPGKSVADHGVADRSRGHRAEAAGRGVLP